MSDVQIITVLVLVLALSMYLVLQSLLHILSTIILFLGNCSLLAGETVNVRFQFNLYRVSFGIIGFVGILFSTIKLATY